MSELLRRAVDILDQLRLAGDALTIRDLAGRLDLPKSTVQRLLRDLVETEMATQDPATKRYRLGPRTLALGTAYQRGISLRNLVRPAIIGLRDRTGETVGLSVAIGEELIHIDQAESTSQLRRTFEIGHPLPLWCGAPSRLLLAELPDDEVRRIVGDRDHTDVVPAGPPNPEQMVAAVEQARNDGYSMAFDETIAGVSTIAAPLRGPDGHGLATLSVTGPSNRFSRPAMKRILPDLLATAAEVSALLGAPSADRPHR